MLVPLVVGGVRARRMDVPPGSSKDGDPPQQGTEGEKLTGTPVSDIGDRFSCGLRLDYPMLYSRVATAVRLDAPDRCGNARQLGFRGWTFGKASAERARLRRL